MKLATKLGGGGELVLRAIPLLAALVSIFPFWRVTNMTLSPRAVPMAVALFALSPTLIYFSAEAKQYSSDVAITIVLLWATVRYVGATLNALSLLEFSAIGAVAIWFSHPASFLLTGIAAMLFAFALLEHNQAAFRRVLLLTVVWTSSFLLCYFVLLRSLGKDQALLNFWRDSFPPNPLASMQGINWIADAVLKLFNEPAALVDFLGLALFSAGSMALVQRNRKLAGCLLAPIGVTYLACLLGLYPLEPLTKSPLSPNALIRDP
jgi:hypothetical protein